MQSTIGNAAVARLARAWSSAPGSLIIRRAFDQDVRNAISQPGRFLWSDAGDFKKAWGILNSLSMADMLTAMQSLHVSGHLSKLTGHNDDAKHCNVRRLMLGVQTVQLKASGVDAVGLARIGAAIDAAGGERDAVESFLLDHRVGTAGLLSGVSKPDASTVAKIDAILNPGSVTTTTVPSSTGPTTTVSVSVPWDGDGTTRTHLAKGKALKRELMAALKRHLAAVMPAMRKLKKAPKIPMERVEGAGKQSKRVVDAMFGSIATSAALTTGQQSARTAFGYNKGVDLFDISTVRTPDAADLASWMAESDAAASAAQRAHNFDKTRRKEAAFLETEVLNPFVAANKADLDIYDVFGFAITDTKSQRVTTLPPESKGKSKKGVPSDQDRTSLWQEWKVLVHEYIHTLEHPGFSAAVQSRRAMNEGFCEMFTKQVLSTNIPIAQSDGDAALRAGVEGTDSAGKPFSGFKPTFVGPYNAGEYAGYLTQAESIRGATSEEAVRSAFFHGHVELIGLDPNGDKLSTPGLGGTPAGPTLPAPKGVTSIFHLGVVTRTSTNTIVAANPGLKQDSPVPSALVLPGCQLHTVVEATETRPSGAILDRRAENGTEIANLYGVTEGDIALANPGVDLKKLTAGATLFIPAR